ncbi:uncharacterized protein RSE6_06637 [Rhynchosporium secalis]|uniref:Secreted protein n=1 Tax=Rhynchosporium secalis TaxID=38038 RepID=A0A1E1MAZ2_RHYSE|nr:uncharacterized protein RSE6_06637 [Rhynchosporium secalis]
MSSEICLCLAFQLLGCFASGWNYGHVAKEAVVLCHLSIPEYTEIKIKIRESWEVGGGIHWICHSTWGTKICVQSGLETCFCAGRFELMLPNNTEPWGLPSHVM